MKVLIYCQHVLGIGHLFRTLEIARAMKEHTVTLVLGGPPASLTLPDHIRVVQLPGLQMDAAFSALYPVDRERTLGEVRTERAEQLCSLVKEMHPDIFMVELFPFGRNGFSFELLPVLQGIRNGQLPPCRVVCSLRDILVEKTNQAKFEQRVIERLNTLFDALFVHSDPNLIKLDDTFSRVHDITIPIMYTGYICEKSSPGEGHAIRKRQGIQPETQFLLVSAGGGNVGYQLLEAVIRSTSLLEFPFHMQIFTGPYLDNALFLRLKQQEVYGVRVERFADNFPAWLSAADLSISMGGYNTIMNVLGAGTPALILPFSQNREQRMRCEKIVLLYDNVSMLDENNLFPAILAEKITAMINKQKQTAGVLLDGAQKTNQWLSELNGEGLRDE